jgi:hypothetical protein
MKTQLPDGFGAGCFGAFVAIIGVSALISYVVVRAFA